MCIRNIAQEVLLYSKLQTTEIYLVLKIDFHSYSVRTRGRQQKVPGWMRNSLCPKRAQEPPLLEDWKEGRWCSHHFRLVPTLHSQLLASILEVKEMCSKIQGKLRHRQAEMSLFLHKDTDPKSTGPDLLGS